MTSRTSGGLIKTSTAWEPEILERAEQFAGRRRSSRSSALNYLVARGLEVEEAEQAELGRLRNPNPTSKESAA